MHDLPQPPKEHVQFAKHTPSPISSIIKFPPSGGQKETTYHDLICTDLDRSNIFELVTTLADNGKLSLLLKQSYLKNIGAQINHVHPLRFLGFIFSTLRLKECMVEIFDDYFKRTGFMDGLGPSLSREADKGKIDIYLNDFAKEIKIPVEQLRPFFQIRDWEGIVRYLMQP